MRIASLLPAATEIVCSLGLGDRLVAASHECDFPADVVAGVPQVTASLIPDGATSAEIDQLVRQRVAGRRPLYRLDGAALAAARPDLIVTQALCDVCAVDDAEVVSVAAALPNRPAVITLEPTSVAGLFDAITAVAAAADVDGRAVVAGLRGRLDAVAKTAPAVRPTVVFLEWTDPPFGSGHWTPELVAIAGGQELIGVAGQRSRRLSWADVTAADPDVIVVAPCGFDRTRANAEVDRLWTTEPTWPTLRAVRAGRVLTMDGSVYFNRPGPRLIDGCERLAALLR